MEASRDHLTPVAVPPEPINWWGAVPFIALHAAVLTVFWVGISPIAVAVALVTYFGRMFVLTGFYHRYFSHRTFRTGRVVQCAAAFAGTTALQRGPLWWAAHHRYHHNHADEASDPHSPTRHGFWWSHNGWFLTKSGTPVRERLVRDWMQFPELRFVDRFHFLGPVLLSGALFALGAWLHAVAPQLGTSGLQMFVWGFVVSTVALYQATHTINSLSHQFGSQRFKTGDDSRNNWLLALLTMGEGWHNNHHHYPTSARQGFYWYEVDITYYGLRGLALLRVLSGLKPVPARVLANGRGR